MDFLREHVIGYPDDELGDSVAMLLKLFGFAMACILFVGVVGVTVTHWQ